MTRPPHVQQALATARPCPRCGVIDTPALGPGRGQHYAQLCYRHGHAHLRWVSQYSDAERFARQEQGKREGHLLKARMQEAAATRQALAAARQGVEVDAWLYTFWRRMA